MSAYFLLKSVSRFLDETMTDYFAAQDSKGVFKPPKVFEWYLPFKNPKIQEDIDFPYIAVRIDNGRYALGESRNHESTVNIELSFGLYCEAIEKDGIKHPDGAYDLLNLMEHVRTALLKQKIIDNKYEIQLPYDWDIPQEQPYPLWIGIAKTQWKIQSVEPQVNTDIFANKKFHWEK